MKDLITPDYIFESSWEVCNKVGGIYTVLSTRAKTLQEQFRDKVFFIGPDIHADNDNPLFAESDELFRTWRLKAQAEEGLKVRIGRWNVPGNPIAILVDFQDFYKDKNEIYAKAWEYFGIDSLHAYGDYDEASMFSYAAGKVAESFYRHYLNEPGNNVVYQAHEWMTGMGALFLKRNVPEIAVIFTTHATTIGRSIAGNGKPLYDYMFAYDGDQMACELNVQSKHSTEKQTAAMCDCFTTVSEITARECAKLLYKAPDVILPNGFENDFVPKRSKLYYARQRSRKLLLNVAEKLLGRTFDKDTLLLSIGGRYEVKNKGIDVFIDMVSHINRKTKAKLEKEAIAFMFVPAWVNSPRQDLLDRLNSKEKPDSPLEQPFITHWLNNMNEDQALNMIRQKDIANGVEDKMKIIFVPCYLDGRDGIFNRTYYELLSGMDLNIYPSYYEPWGYTPLESAAFKVPTITTDLAGFGLWIKSEKSGDDIKDGIRVVHRTDSNYNDAVDEISEIIIKYSNFTDEEKRKAHINAAMHVDEALWCKFIEHYYKAYDYALRNNRTKSK